jgi:MFS family permease
MLAVATGLVSVGMALGPIVGGLLIRASHQVLPAFYSAVILLLFFVAIVLIFLPESLSQEQKLANKIAYAARQRDGSVWARVFTFLAPLSIFFPTKSETAPGTSSQSGTDWNLTLVAVAYAIFMIILVSRATAPGHRAGGS